MPLASVIELVKSQLPFLTEADDSFITATQNEMFYDYFVSALGKAETITEADLSIDERLFWAYVTAYNLGERIAAKGKIQAGSAQTLAVPKTIEKAKADVTEVSYKIISQEEAGYLYLSSGEVLSRILRNVCAKASKIGVEVPACALLYPESYAVIPTFRLF